MQKTISRNSFVFSLRDIDKTTINVAGGKAANLGELSGIESIHVPEGFCISTEAFKKIIKQSPSISDLLNRLSQLNLEEKLLIGELSSQIRSVMQRNEIPQDIHEEIKYFIKRFGENNAYAVRSSATAEDLPTASFAGQQDTYLNIIGENEILEHISKCWASLFTERAVIYRIQNGFDHHKVQLAVIVQKMVFPEAAGILFTADPITSNRKVVSIDASFGLGEAVVSGIVNADNYKVLNRKIIDKKISNKKLAIYALKDGGTKEQQIENEKQTIQALTDAQVLNLEQIGRNIEKHFGYPQDIEWCLKDNAFYIVQSRPITTLFPLPARTGHPGGPQINDQENHLYVSVGHQQMMTDAMKPLGISFWQLISGRDMFEAGGRMFVDIAANLASATGREIMINVLGKSDPLMRDAMMTIIDRGDFIQPLPGDEEDSSTGKKPKNALPNFQAQIEYQPDIVPDLISKWELSLEELKTNIQKKSGPDLFDYIMEDIQQARKLLTDPVSFAVIMTGINASSWINEKMESWLDEKNSADIISQSLSDNITSEMGLALLDVADEIRPFPEVINYLEKVKDEIFLEDMSQLKGGPKARDAIYAYLNKYGMRCLGEIDITRTRWSEKPSILLPLILSNIKNFAPGAGKLKFEKGLKDASKKERELLTRLEQLPDGKQKAKETKEKIDLVRNFMGFREYPKYAIVSRYFVYKQALLNEAEKLVKANLINEKEDIFFLRFDELREVVSEQKLDYRNITKRKDEFKIYEKLTPPRVMTSDGEIITGKYKRENLPADSIVGLAVSSGMVEGRARVIFNLEDAELEKGDILVTSFTDPSWTPLFLSIKGLVTEVGGHMTHGAVIAREYGLPAVVGVENATRLIKDGQRIRVNGTEGYVEIL